MSSPEKRMQIFFSGTVQGVGFRFTAERLARRFPITGFVRNLEDGRVEVVAEGEEASLVEFLTAIRESGMKDYIRDVEAHWSRVDVYDPDGSRVASRQLASSKLADRARDGFVHRAGKVPEPDERRT